jgi:hypothetical protein
MSLEDQRNTVIVEINSRDKQADGRVDPPVAGKE